MGDRTIAFQNLAVIQEAVQAQPFVGRTTQMHSDHNRHVLLMYRSVQQELTDEILAFFARNRKEKATS